MKSLVLIGNGGHCKSCIDIIESTNKYRIKGIIVHPNDSSDTFMNYKVLGNDNDIGRYFIKNDYALICIGQIKSPEKRINIFNLLNKNKIPMATIKSKYSIVSRYSNIGYGSIVMHNVIINASSEIGHNCILNTNSLIEHDVTIGNHCHISTGVIINGGVNIGDCYFSGCIIKEGVRIGKRAIISAGKIVMEDIPSGVMLK